MKACIAVATLTALALGLASCDPGEPPTVVGAPGTFTGTVTRVVDGDTFWLDSRDVSIRVFGLDAPETNEPGGSTATAALMRLIGGDRLTCRQRDVDRYGRIVGQCLTSDGRDIAAVMISAGLAAEYCRYSGGEYGTC